MNHALRPVGGARAEIEVRHSRFIAIAERTPQAEDARAVIDRIKGEFPDARHHCSAFIVSNPGNLDTEHSSDDGEPAGTAGRPMLDVLRGAGLGQITVVVVRYFGGVLLGTGGLVRAYSDAVRTVLDGMPLARVETMDALAVDVDHATAGPLEGALQGAGIAPTSRDYTAEGVRFTLAVGDIGAAGALIAAATAGAARCVPLGPVEVEVPQ